MLGVAAVDWPSVDAGAAEFEALASFLGRGGWVNADLVEFAPVPLLSLGKVSFESAGTLSPFLWIRRRLVYAGDVWDAYGACACCCCC